MILDKLECLIGSVVTSAACIGLTIAFYEGVSVPSFVPLVGGVSIINGVVDRRVNAALDGYVLKTEMAAASAKAAEQKRQADATKAAFDRANQRAAVAEAANAAAQIDRQKERADYEAKLKAQGGGCYLNDGDDDGRNFLLRHQ